jgi:hypothetical protein
MLRHVRTTPWAVLLSYVGCDMHFLKDHVALGILKDHEADLPVTSLWECSLCIGFGEEELQDPCLIVQSRPG